LLFYRKIITLKIESFHKNLLFKNNTFNSCFYVQRKKQIIGLRKKTFPVQSLKVIKRAFQQCTVEKEVATFIKISVDEILGPTWQCIVGRSFGSHLTYEYYAHFTYAKFTIILLKCC
uniref:Dynein light chain n=1 Tax=Enterobius vermicularis TaxID=51028 RepID=A0A0N4UUM2_ENTVE